MKSNKKLKYLLKLLLPPILTKAWKRVAGHKQGNTKDSALYQEHLRLNRHAKCGQVFLRENIAFNIHPDCKAGIDYFCFGCPEMIDEMNAFIALSANCKYLLDIGALHGVFSLSFTATDSAHRAALAVDASPLAFSKLLYNVHKNPGFRIEPVECALSNKVGLLEMAYEWEHAVACAKQIDDTPTLSIVSTTGDLLCAEKSYAPDVIKIDVEGHEISVFEGLETTISTLRPLIFLEVHPIHIAAAGRSLKELWSQISGRSYNAQRVNGSLVSEREFLALDTDTRLVLLP